MFKTKHCCSKMRKAVNFSCDIHKNMYDCPDALIILFTTVEQVVF